MGSSGKTLSRFDKAAVNNKEIVAPQVSNEIITNETADLVITEINNEIKQDIIVNEEEEMFLIHSNSPIQFLQLFSIGDKISKKQIIDIIKSEVIVDSLIKANLFEKI